MTDPPDTVNRVRDLRVYVAVVALLGAVLLLSSCAPGQNAAAGTGQDPAGFWLGLWHGIIFPVTFVISPVHGQRERVRGGEQRELV